MGIERKRKMWEREMWKRYKGIVISGKGDAINGLDEMSGIERR